MVAYVARVPGAARRPAELGRLAGTLWSDASALGPKPFRCGLSRTTTHAAKAEDSFRTALAIAQEHGTRGYHRGAKIAAYPARG
jgi:hypothetical protein